MNPACRKFRVFKHTRTRYTTNNPRHPEAGEAGVISSTRLGGGFASDVDGGFPEVRGRKRQFDRAVGILRRRNGG